MNYSAGRVPHGPNPPNTSTVLAVHTASNIEAGEGVRDPLRHGYVGAPTVTKCVAGCATEDGAMYARGCVDECLVWLR